MPSSYDAIVIGSGFGGSVAACRLAQAGHSVCVVERGRFWNATDFPRSPTEVAQQAFWAPDDRQHGLLDYRVFDGMHVIQGSGVGGGSLHYFNVHIRPPASIFEDERWPSSVNRQSLAPYYDLARDMLDAAPFAPPTGRPTPTRTKAFTQATHSTGRAADAVELAIYTGDGRINDHGGAPQRPCDYSGACGLGCAQHAKNTLDLNYLALAQHHGAEIVPLHQVTSITPRRGGGYHVDADELVLGASEPVGTRRLSAPIVIVAAGTLGTNELLLQCRDTKRTLPKLSAALGRGFSGNGDFLFAGIKAEQDIDASRGPSITAGADFISARQEAYIEDLGIPEVIAWFAEGLLVDRISAAWQLLGFVFTEKARIRGATRRLARERSALLRGSLTRDFLPLLGMCEDAADGQFQLNEEGTIDLQWDVAASRANLMELIDGMRQLGSGLNGEFIQSPLWDDEETLLTAHPLGGCPMSPDASSGVIDEHGQVHGYRGLYVMDGSVVPTALARNPSATITALAERAVFWLLHGSELLSQDPRTPSNRMPTA